MPSITITASSFLFSFVPRRYIATSMNTKNSSVHVDQVVRKGCWVCISTGGSKNGR